MKLTNKEKWKFINFLEVDNPKLWEALVTNWKIGNKEIKKSELYRGKIREVETKEIVDEGE